MIRIGSGTHIVKIAAIIGALVFVLQILEMSSMVSILFALSIICVVASYILRCVIDKRIKAVDMLLLAIMLMSIVSAGVELNFDYYKPAIIVLCCLICMDLCPHNYIDERTRKKIVLLFTAVSIFAIFMFYWGGLDETTYGTTSLVSLNFGNPNEASMWLTFLFLILQSAINSQQKLASKLILIVTSILLVPILLATGSRACLMALAVYFLLMLLLHLFKVRKIPTWMIFLITIMPAVIYFAYMYIVIPYMDVFENIFSFMISRGKNLSNRVLVWGQIDEDIFKCLLFGQYDKYYDQQMHNSLVTMYGRFGLGFVVLLCYKFYRLLRELDNKTMQLPLSAVWLIGCFETSFLGGMAGAYLLLLVLPQIAVPPSLASNGLEKKMPGGDK